MIKRLLIVLAWAIGIVFVPYFVGKFTPIVKNYESFNSRWADGFVSISLVVLSVLAILGAYSCLCLIYDYIIGKK